MATLATSGFEGLISMLALREPTPCMPCSFGLLPHRRSTVGAQPTGPFVSDRECPLHTVGYRCLWHADGTASEHNEARTWRRWLPARPDG
jgi:hypothetical protein